MSDEGGPKSSFELAMERLRKKDAEEGVTTRPMTDQQKSAIAEVRSLYDSKIAEQEILQQSAMKHLLNADPAEREEVSRRFRRERERLASERDAKVEKIRRGEGWHQTEEAGIEPASQFLAARGSV
jgi:hypothetical protein